MGEEQLYRFFQTDSEETVLNLKKKLLEEQQHVCPGFSVRQPFLAGELLALEPHSQPSGMLEMTDLR